MTYKKIIVIFAFFGTSSFILNLAHTEAQKPKPEPKELARPKFSPLSTKSHFIEKLDLEILDPKLAEAKDFSKLSKTSKKSAEKLNTTDENSTVFTVPFFSQFSNITNVSWKKVGCGIASLAMLIEFYEPGATSVDNLLAEGIESDAYISSAGWSHAGLINLSKKYGLGGSSRDMANLSMSSAFEELQEVLKEGPVMVSVHYTFDPKNPIPHLVVINGVSEGKVFYNDPAEPAGGGSISISKFQSAWKKRYIEIHSA